MSRVTTLDASFVYDTIGLLYDTGYYGVTPEEIRDALSKGQLTSKMWLAEVLRSVIGVGQYKEILIVGGWIGTLANIIMQYNDNVQRITSIDLNPMCERAARQINSGFPGFTAMSGDMYNLNYDNFGGYLIINTSCEHIADVRGWLDLLPKGTLVALQSNNMFGVEGHVNCCNNLTEFTVKCNLDETIYKGSFVTNEHVAPPFERYMIVGRT